MWHEGERTGRWDKSMVPVDGDFDFVESQQKVAIVFVVIVGAAVAVVY